MQGEISCPEILPVQSDCIPVDKLPPVCYTDHNVEGAINVKKFFTAVPLQAATDELGTLTYQAVGNSRLQMDRETSFPILTAVSGYVQPGEDFRLIALVQDTPAGQHNGARLDSQLEELCRRKGLRRPQVERVVIPQDDSVSAHTATFQKLLDYAEDGDELFACMTFGTKPLSQAMLLAVQYAYRVKRDSSISCVVYGAVDHARPKPWKTGFVYDMTALLQLDEIVHMLAERGVSDPRAALDGLLSL